MTQYCWIYKIFFNIEYECSCYTKKNYLSRVQAVSLAMEDLLRCPDTVHPVNLYVATLASSPQHQIQTSQSVCLSEAVPL